MTTTKTAMPTAKTTAMMLIARRKQVKEWMSPNPVTVLPTVHVDAAYQLMSERHIRRLPGWWSRSWRAGRHRPRSGRFARPGRETRGKR